MKDMKAKKLNSFEEVIYNLQKDFSMNPWGLVGAVIESAIQNYSGYAKYLWQGEGSFGKVAKIEVTSSLAPAKSNTAVATVVWRTSSDHSVTIKFTHTKEVGWVVDSYILGKDKSEFFYSEIKRIMESDNIVKNKAPNLHY